MRERDIEHKLVTETQRRGGLAWKLTSPANRGVPDRLIILPHTPPAFIEVKAPGKHPTPLQHHQHQQLTQLGQTIYTLDNPNDIERILNEIQTTPLPTTHNQLHPHP